jgi:hypothetical protein
VTPRRRRSVWLLVAAAVALAGYFLLPEPPAAEIRALLGRTAAAVRAPGGVEGAALEQALGRAFDAEAVVRIPELPPLAPGPRALVELVESTRARHARVGLELTSVDVRVDADGRAATAQADAVLTLQRPAAMREEARQLTARLERADADWKIVAITVAAKTYPEPEARP